MFQSIVIGNLGGDAVVKNDNGREFTAFRVAHNERYTDSQGTQHDSTMWVDCVINGQPNVLPYLKAGQLVMVQGNTSIKMYDSAVDHCKKATARINVQKVELLGGALDRVPRTLYDDQGNPHSISKYFLSDVKGGSLRSRSGEVFAVDDNGWVVPASDVPAEVQAQLNQGSQSSKQQTK